MRLAVDTNVILRLLVRDDARQTAVAAREIKNADAVILSMVALCEAAWVMERTYRFSRAAIAERFRDLIEAPAVECDLDEVQAGLAMLDAGGDFADGVIARQGRRAFDRKAVTRLVALGGTARLPA